MKYTVFYKMSISLIMLFVILLSVKCQDASTGDGVVYTAGTLLKEEKDWQTVKNTVLSLCDTPEQCEKYRNGTFWYQRGFEEKVHRRNLNVTVNFLHKYPDSDHYFDALKYYFSYLVEPRFIDSVLEKDKGSILDQKKMIVNGDKSGFYKQFRALPFHMEERSNWLRQGDSLVQDFIKTDAPIKQKVEIEVAKLARDKRMARYLYEFLSPNKIDEEAEYWSLFDAFFWKNFIDEMGQLILKYPDYPEWLTDIDLFIEGISLDFLSPEMKVPLWEHFRDITDRPDLFDNYPMIAQVHKKTKENLKALKAKEGFDGIQPLQMEFIAMDGKKVNLEDYRGKVVLIDFWSIRCAPCIQEMPHVRALYDKYREQGFEVIGISAEDNASEGRVKEIIQKQGANWPQLLDKSADVMVSYLSLFNISSFPTVWLLNKEGVIVDRNARGNRLEPLIRKYLEMD